MENLEKILNDYVVATLKSNNCIDYKDSFEVQSFIRTALKYQLDPYLKDIYLIPTKKYRNVNGNNVFDGYTFQSIVSYHKYVEAAQNTGLLNGISSEYFFVNNQLEKIVVTIHKKGCEKPFLHTVYLDEYVLDTKIWRTKPKTMLNKIALVQALRIAFQIRLPYIFEEIENCDNPNASVDTTPIEKVNFYDFEKYFNSIGIGLKLVGNFVVAYGIGDKNLYTQSHILKSNNFVFDKEVGIWKKHKENFSFEAKTIKTVQSPSIAFIKDGLEKNKIDFDFKVIKGIGYFSVPLKDNELDKEQRKFLDDCCFHFYENKSLFGLKIEGAA
ncbi:hypothetical protein CQA57_05795 [Helicobacter anseris]|uniref:Uncharacterized protein n=1 Tax=Helicobacter anseris TaxID=375926 RepID=A0A3D8J6G1_9HELI|nr:recombinase RecT [Helicobacter anseris]RDU73038.1 hypothetical protein CQA57_05795 [Helicobacter anseris]